MAMPLRIVNVTYDITGIVSMCKLQRITIKLNEARGALY